MTNLEHDITAALFAHVMDRWHALYQHTGNPLHAWHAWRTARQWGMATPEWVAEYLDGCAHTLTLTSAPPTTPQAIADAFGLRTTGGPSVTTQAAHDIRDLAIVERIVQLQQRPTYDELLTFKKTYRVRGVINDEGDRNILDVFAQVAKEFDLSEERVQSIYYDLIR